MRRINPMIVILFAVLVMTAVGLSLILYTITLNANQQERERIMANKSGYNIVNQINSELNSIHQQGSTVQNHTDAIAQQIKTSLAGGSKPTLAAKISLDNQKLLKEILVKLNSTIK